VRDHQDPREWYSVRCVVDLDDHVEERVTLWRARSPEDAVSRALAEAQEHAADLGPGAVLREDAACFLLDDEPGDGAEVFVLGREAP
jgi:hypothetical protein